MSTTQFPQPLDVAIMLNAQRDRSAMTNAAMLHLRRRRPTWNYNEIRDSAPPILTQARTRDEAISCCGRRYSPEGWEFNKIAAGLLYDLMAGQVEYAKVIGSFKQQFQGTRFSLRTPALTLVRTGAQMYLVDVMPRKTHRATDIQKAYYCWLLRLALSTTEYASLPLRFAWLARDENKGIEPISFWDHDLPVIDESEMHKVLDSFYQSFLVALEKHSNLPATEKAKPGHQDNKRGGDTLWDWGKNRPPRP